MKNKLAQSPKMSLLVTASTFLPMSHNVYNVFVFFIQTKNLHRSWSIYHAKFSKYAESHKNLLQTQKYGTPNLPKTRSKHNQKKCEISKKVHCNIKTQRE